MAPRCRPVLAAAGLALALAACAPAAGPSDADGTGTDAGFTVLGEQPEQLHGTDIGDVVPRPPLVLDTIDGDRFDLQDRPGDELTLLFFGYSRCPDVCPTALADLAAARRQLPDQQAARLQVAFVTEDPEHDTRTVLRPWLDRFDPSILGLVGGNPATEGALDALAAPRTEVLPAAPARDAGHLHDAGADPHSHTNGAGDTVEHTGSVYAFTGDRVVVYTGGTTPDQYAEDFRQLLAD